MVAELSPHALECLHSPEPRCRPAGWPRTLVAVSATLPAGELYDPNPLAQAPGQGYEAADQRPEPGFPLAEPSSRS